MDAKHTPRMDELMSRYLVRQLAAASTGVEATQPSEVESFDAVIAPTVDPRLAWDGAIEPLRYFAPYLKLPTKIPSGWAAIVNALPPAVFLPMAVGHFPQAVRDLNAVLESSQTNVVDSIDSPSANQFIDSMLKSNDPANWFIAVGAARLINDKKTALKLLSQKQSDIPSELRIAWANERATLAFVSGQTDEATQTWKSLPDSAPVHFNRGVGHLATDRCKDAIAQFKAASSQIPESSGWHHLAELFLAVAEAR
jgi:hypothetical protein